MATAQDRTERMTEAWDCEICSVQRYGGHWAWHRFCRAELNPIALVQRLRAMPQTDEVTRVLRYVETVTGMDVEAAMAELKTESAE